ncbi:MAG TPA: RDD family protein [Solirubrobacterales bacterium]|nr:RDD family protein [Solirubrobacterales bacterium]
MFGRGARGAGRVAEATGLDRAVEQAAEEAIVRAVESEAVERAVARMLEGPALDEAVKRALESPAVEQAWERMLASDEAQRLVERIADAPEVRAAIAAQSAGLIEDIARQVRAVARRLDAAVERGVRRVLFRPRRSEPTDRGGVVSRALALGLDAMVLNASFFAASALVALAASVFLPDPEGVSTPALVFGTGAWLAAAALYLLVFWSLAGQTPGMRFLGLVIHADGSRRIGFGRSVRRLVGLVAGAIPLGLGFLGVLLGERRRGLADVFADTEVLYVEPTVREAPWSQMASAR